jgi:hypothetical protein
MNVKMLQTSETNARKSFQLQLSRDDKKVEKIGKNERRDKASALFCVCLRIYGTFCDNNKLDGVRFELFTSSLHHLTIVLSCG